MISDWSHDCQCTQGIRKEIKLIFSTDKVHFIRVKIWQEKIEHVLISISACFSLLEVCDCYSGRLKEWHRHNRHHHTLNYQPRARRISDFTRVPRDVPPTHTPSIFSLRCEHILRMQSQPWGSGCLFGNTNTNNNNNSNNNNVSARTSEIKEFDAL